MHQPPALGISIGRDQLVAAAQLQTNSTVVVASPPMPALAALVSREDGSLGLECGEWQRPLRFDNHPAVAAHARALLGVPYASTSAQGYAAHHPATKIVQRNGKLCFELELDARAKEERQQLGLNDFAKTFTPVEVVATLVAEAKRTAEAHLGVGLTRAVLTVPPDFDDAQRMATKDAGILAGLNVMRIITEPVAAAIAYGLDKLSNYREFPVLVFNMGATTLTATVLAIEDGIYERLASRTCDLGGNQFVDNMAEHCAAQFQQLHGIDLRQMARPMLRLRRACERGMTLLSQDVQTTIELDCIHSDIDLQCNISRARFEHLNSRLFEQSLKEVDTVLGDAKRFRADQIEHVVLSGGCCNMPKVQAMLKAHFPQATMHHSIKPEEVEAYGAACQAAILCGPPVTSWWEMAPAPFWNITGAGLYHERACLSLTSSQVDVSIVETRAEVTVTQSFTNTTTNPLETTYVYPVEEGSAVFAFSAEIDGRLVRAVIKEKQQAKEDYEDAISSGHGAYLLEELTGDIFQINVGNLPAGSVATIKISYASDLPLEGNKLRFSLPTFSSSKYVPPGSQATSTDSSVATVGACTDIAIRCTTASPLISISSPTHPDITTKIQDCSGTTTLSASLAKEFVLKIEEAAPRAPRLWIETNEGAVGPTSRAAAVTLYPEFPPTSNSDGLPVEIIFLLDRSGSMSGESIKQARNALMLFLKSLPGDHVSFNIVGFGSTHETLFESSVAYDDVSLQKAQQHVLSLDADLGGTEILRPLEDIFRIPERPGVPRQVILLTDGEVGNTEQVIQCVRQHSKATRVFTLGIGAGASHRLIKGVAHAGRGTYELVASEERLEGKVMRQLRNALQPFMTDATVSWGSLAVRDSAPQTIGPLYSGQKVTLFALLDKDSPLDPDVEVRFEARSADGPVSCSARLAGSSNGALLHTLAAKRIIAELEEESKAAGLRPDRRERIREHVLATSLQYGVASSEASFVAVEEREDSTQGTMISAVPEMTSCVGGAAAPKMVKTQRTASALGDVLLLDVCPLTLGFDVADTGLVRPVILRNTTIPCRKVKTCMITVPADGQLRFAFYEGERPMAADNSLLGELSLPVPHLATAQVSVEVTFDIDANGILNVTASETTTGLKDRVVITNDQGRLSKHDIERMVMEAEAARDADQEIRRMIEVQCGGAATGTTVAEKKTTPFDGNIGMALGAVGSLSRQVEEHRRQQAAKVEAQYAQLIALQKANGEWALTPVLLEVLRFDAKQRAPSSWAQLEPHSAAAAMATLAALAFLYERVPDRREEWELLAAKAHARLHHLLAGLGDREAVRREIDAAIADTQRAIAAGVVEAEQTAARVLTQATSLLDTVRGLFGELRDLLLLLPGSPAPTLATATAAAPSTPLGPRIEEVD